MTDRDFLDLSNRIDQKKAKFTELPVSIKPNWR
jgi:hypothetical protein